jgi:putative FmdB family regulatory protein
MPTYQYACTEPACGHRFELVQSFTDPSASECPVCTGHVRKVYGSVGVVFKGSGFYRTDSRSDGRSAGNGKSEAKSDTKSESSSSDSKPAAKADSSSKASTPASTPASTGSKAAAN